VYPEEAYLYDPPIIPGGANGPLETTEYRSAGDGSSIYGVHGESLLPVGLARARTPPDSAATERDGLLGRARRNTGVSSARSRTNTDTSSGTRAHSGSIGANSVGFSPPGSPPQPMPLRTRMNPLSMNPLGAYVPTPTDEEDVVDQAHRADGIQDPFADPPAGEVLNREDPDLIQPVRANVFGS
jgi:hypothetical protein